MIVFCAVLGLRLLAFVFEILLQLKPKSIYEVEVVKPDTKYVCDFLVF